jgi:hypothetical protein
MFELAHVIRLVVLLYKGASQLGFREAENYVELFVSHVCPIPLGLAYCDGESVLV